MRESRAALRFADIFARARDGFARRADRARGGCARVSRMLARTSRGVFVAPTELRHGSGRQWWAVIGDNAAEQWWEVRFENICIISCSWRSFCQLSAYQAGSLAKKYLCSNCRRTMGHESMVTPITAKQHRAGVGFSGGPSAFISGCTLLALAALHGALSSALWRSNATDKQRV